ncbi:Homeobox-leucine zipper protein [Musa troglodytarum]|uniref:Homeobox-leucine zipper protein n=1 Tax=Musa troglodytarum TaxID=320322 RepID=A0A9E7F030_9LILI|nr:Homeobox-leucine zipper protein [Musa troglodytarum]
MDSGDEQDVPNSQSRKKRYHRHTPRQIQELESYALFSSISFSLYVVQGLSAPGREAEAAAEPGSGAGAAADQVLVSEPKDADEGNSCSLFLFSLAKSTQKKNWILGQQERADNCLLRADNDKIRCENIAMREALKNVICPSCGGPPPDDDSYFDEQKLRMDNTRLKEELDRVSGLASKYLGRPLTQLPPVQPVSISSLDLSAGGYGDTGISPSLDLDLLCRSSSSAFPFQCPSTVSELEKPLMVEMATGAMEEVIRLVQTDEPLWVKSSDGRDILQLETYNSMFQRPGRQLKFPGTRVEASRDSALVIMGAMTLIDMFMDVSKWAELFPTIVSKARTIEVLAAGMAGSRSGSLLLMYEEIQVLSPVVPTREFCFLRYCQQIEPGMWVVADVSVADPRDNQLALSSRSRRLPSGYLIEEMPNGYTKLTWVEHMEIVDKNPIHILFRDLMNSGLLFGAQRWLAALQRMCERFACLNVAGLPARDIGVAPSPDGKRSMMKLAQRMLSSFCANVGASNGYQWNTISGLNDVGVRVTVHKTTDAGRPDGVVLNAATSMWLPLSSEKVFGFFKDERTRSQWDVLSNGNTVQVVAHITNGSHPGNCISLLRGLNSGQNTMLILQECCTDAYGSVVVYSPVDLPAINIVMSGEDPSYIPILPSGFTILPDGRAAAGASSSSNPMIGSSGSLLTVAFQILMSSLPSAKLNLESVMTVNNLIGTTVQQIKSALNCPDI